ncbi:unnamed protein product [Urochloa decumbens]|uniref:F-box domain-containing protein n=1 Tax=Urochloa decumbens TaxID=240449 RepID=A0ABC9BAD7_9POAL
MASSSSSIIGHRWSHLAVAQEQEQPPVADVPHREGKGEEEEETRDWAALPVDVLLAVLSRLGGVDILMGAGQVCQPWRRATREEPELWHRVDMRRRAGLAYNVDLQAAARAAVRRSAGRCEAFLAEDVASAHVGYDNAFFLFLADAAPMLKSLRLISCNLIHGHLINKAIRKFPLLEELELSLMYHLNTFNNCLNQDRFYFSWYRWWGSKEVARMHGLRSLQLFASSISNNELAGILDGCQQLESLDIRHCFNISMNEEMQAKCARVKTVRLPGDSMEDYDLRYGSPVNNFTYYSGVHGF